MSVRVAQRRGWWMVDIRALLPDGRRIRERRKAPANSRSAAERWGHQRLNHILNGGFVEPHQQKEVPTLAAFRERFIEGYAKANRQKHSSVVSKESIFEHHLVPALGEKRLDAITTADVQALKGQLAGDGYAPKTVNCILTVLSTALRVAADWGVIDQPRARVRFVAHRIPEIAFYDEAEFERLLAAAAKVDDRAELAVLLGGEAGLRQGEIIALELRDADLKRGQLVVRQGEWRGVVDAPKGGRSRRIPLTERLAAALARARHLRGDRVLYRDDGRTVSPKVLRLWMQAAERLAGLPTTNGGVHILRHTFGARLAMAGAPAKAIQELMGHTSLTTTLRYMHLSPAARESAIRLLESGKRGTRQTPEGGVQEKAR